MKKKRWKKIEPIVDQALSIERPQKRKDFIKQCCDNDKLYQQVTELIESIEEAEEEGFLE
ncbi:MAG: hypothetical protein U5K72_15165 [Balneolaceae bacterium]|nr:hypothetical protein [Balneolaceae bacterium]